MEKRNDFLPVSEALVLRSRRQVFERHSHTVTTSRFGWVVGEDYPNECDVDGIVVGRARNLLNLQTNVYLQNFYINYVKKDESCTGGF